MASPRPGRTRLAAAGVLACCLALLSVAAWIRPEASGLGSHRQLGLPPCTLVTLVGCPCPTCGMSTAFAHTVRGELLSAFHAQPAGMVLALATILTASVSLGVLITGKSWAVNWYRVSPIKVTLGVILLVLGGWLYKLATTLASGASSLGR